MPAYNIGKSTICILHKSTLKFSKELQPMDWLDQVLESVKDYETPARFFYWSALASVSAILKDSVFLDRGGLYKLYPNVYVLLYGPSGVKKGPAIAFAKNIIRKIDNTRIINGRATVEAIIKELGTSQTRPGKPVRDDSCGFIISSELSSSIVSNPSAMDIMTDLFDRSWNEGEWKYRLKVGESNTLKSPTPVWLSGSNEALFREFVPEKNIKGGLIGRMFVISEHKRNKINSLMFRPSTIPDYDKLASVISPAEKLRGEFEIAEEVKHAMDKWYIAFVTDHEDKIEDDTGFVNRIADMILKVAMLISTARRCDQVLLIEDVTEAIQVTLPLIVPTKKVAASVKTNDIGLIKKRGLVIEYLADAEGKKRNRQDILKRFSLVLDHEDLNRIVAFLEEAKVVKTSQYGQNVVYELNIINPKVTAWLEQYKR